MNKISIELEMFHNYSEARALLPNVYVMLGKIPEKAAAYSVLKSQLDSIVFDIEFCEGTINPSYEAFYLKRLENAPNNCARATASYALAKYYEATGNEKKLKEYAGNAVKYGSGLFIVKYAKSRM